MIQIFGTKKCRNTQKAQRCFKERNLKVHFVDLNEKGISMGEIRNISRSVPLDDLIDKDGHEYEKRNLKYISHNIEEKIMEFPLVLKTPVVRLGGKACVGFNPEIWKEFVSLEKGG